MTNREMVLELMRAWGRSAALELRSQAAQLDDTALIAREVSVPPFAPAKDYSAWPAGAPVEYEGQIYRLLQPHNASYYPAATPANTPALWSITHTKDPARAKPWQTPAGTSGLYMTGEVAIYGDKLWRALVDNVPYEPGAVGTEAYWEDLGSVSNLDTGEI